jgi:predicted amidohydrolase
MSDAHPETVVVAGVQMEPRFADVAYNRNLIVERLRDAASRGARFVAFPECALTGYIFEDRAEALAVAEPVPGPSTRTIAEACAALGVWAAVGMLERDGDALYNACALVGPGGPGACYRKTHLPFMGVDRFADRGNGPLAVHDVGGLRVGLHICYDGAFPEVGRVLTLRGADLLVLPTNWPSGAEAQAEHLMIGRAVENVVHVLAVNRVGAERGARFIGRSSIVDALGRVLARAGAETEETLVAEIDPARARCKRIVREPGRAEIDRIGDRRPELYGEIGAGTGD